MTNAAPKIIVIGERAAATENLAQRLKDAGFDASAFLQSAGKPLALPGKPEIAIFMPRVDRDSRTEFARALRNNYAGVKIVMLYEDKIVGAESAHAVIQARTDTDDLVRTLRYLIDSKADPARSA